MKEKGRATLAGIMVATVTIMPTIIAAEEMINSPEQVIITTVTGMTITVTITPTIIAAGEIMISNRE